MPQYLKDPGGGGRGLFEKEERSTTLVLDSFMLKNKSLVNQMRLTWHEEDRKNF